MIVARPGRHRSLAPDAAASNLTAVRASAGLDHWPDRTIAARIDSARLRATGPSFLSGSTPLLASLVSWRLYRIDLVGILVLSPGDRLLESSSDWISF